MGAKAHNPRPAGSSGPAGLASPAPPPAIAGAIEPAHGPLKPASVEADLVASAEWDRLVEARPFDPAEAGTLGAYCTTVALAERLRGEIRNLPELFVTNIETGAVKTHPAIGTLNAVERNLGMLASRLGITPVDRSRVAKSKTKASAAATTPTPTKLARYIK
ncbi:P27 family phage terminase small subunit [Paludisphaera sp.]|uniref:P27 family phage terminase small subunit n=1 Tax=Paludisphaera sp. TaxID=2017432 RepID=UPI00301DB4D7